MNADNTTAIHEAGHAVAHVRFGIQQIRITIEPADGMLGHSLAEGVEHVWEAGSAAKQAIAYCSGYGALVAAGYEQETALAGADDDFEKAQYLIEFWGLGGDVDEWKNRAVALMSEPQNVAAVTLIAGRLERERTIDGEVVGVLVDLSDGNCTQAEFDRFLLFMSRRSHDLVD